MFKRLSKSLFLFLIFGFIFTLTSCGFFNNQNGTLDPSTFDECAQNIFETLVGGDDLTCNYYFNNLEDFGLERGEPSLPKPVVASGLSLIATNIYFGQIKRYDYNQLNDDQKMTYNIICDLIDNLNAKSTEMSYLSNNYLGSYLGYQAQLPLLLVEYHFRNIEDVNNYLKYLALVPETFKSYYDFEVTKSEKGYGMPNFVIDKVISQCDNFIKNIDNGETFMLDVIEDKINECSFLTDEQKIDYISKNNDHVRGPLREGYEYIKLNLPSLKDKAINNTGLANTYNSKGEAIGKKYYEIEFKDTVGYDISCDEAIEYVEDKILEAIAQIRNINSIISDSDKEIVNKILRGEIKLMSNTPEAQLEMYKTLVLNDFPSLSIDPIINLKYIDKSMQDNFSPAAYMTSPIDANGHESIYLNPASIYINNNDELELNFNYLYTTLAHEGIPGHLYQNVYAKSLPINNIRKVIKNGGYSEGWATYTEYYMYNYLEPTYSRNVIDFLYAYQNLEAAVYSRLDLGIHYNGWSITEAYNFMSNYYALSGMDNFTKAYEQLVEIPTNYQKYYFTYLKLMDMQSRVKTALGSNYDPIDFHKTILDCGGCALKYVEICLNNKYGV